MSIKSAGVASSIDKEPVVLVTTEVAVLVEMEAVAFTILCPFDEQAVDMKMDLNRGYLSDLDYSPDFSSPISMGKMKGRAKRGATRAPRPKKK